MRLRRMLLVSVGRTRRRRLRLRRRALDRNPIRGRAHRPRTGWGPALGRRVPRGRWLCRHGP
eukprot:4335555-Pyramimonas_sp.AAC.1